MASFEEQLAKDKKLVYNSRGTSMLPLIREGRDVLVIEAPQGRLKRLDVALYRRADGSYILHRVVKVLPDSYVIRGDNLYFDERGVSDADVLGVLTEIERNGRRISVTDFSYRLYSHLRVCFYHPRRFAHRVAGRLKRMFSAKSGESAAI